MRNALTILILLACAQASFGQLSGPLSGTLGPDTTYHIVGDIWVNFGNTLRILHGTTFYFDGAYSFSIYGTLLAEGTESDSIIFTTDPVANPDRWRGLRFLNPTSSGSRLTFCLIKNGLATDGGGVYCQYSSPTFTNCSISGNSADYGGGGVYCDNYSSPSFTNCSVSGNSADLHGGGVYCDYYYSSPSFTNCTISGNTAGYDGGGMLCFDFTSLPTFTSCTISGNWASRNGGGVYCAGSSPEFTNCVISGNAANGDGGGVYCTASSLTFTNCTISGNAANGDGGGVYCHYSSPTFNSTIIAFSFDGVGIHFYLSTGTEVHYCDIFGNAGGPLGGGVPAGLGQIDTINANGDSCDSHMNIFLDPMFMDWPAGDFHLLINSPCIDAADPSLPVDPDYTVADIGAFLYDHGYRPPLAFNLISPQWDDTCWTLDTMLVWQAALDTNTNDTVTYEVWLDTLSNFSTAWQVDSGLSDTVFALVGLADDHAYYWTVHASDLNTPGTWANNTLMFHTYRPDAPDSFALAAPQDWDTVHTTTPTLRWFEASDPDPGDTVCYLLVWSYDEDFSIYEDTLVCDTSFTFPEEVLFRGELSGTRPTRAKRTGVKNSSALDEVADDSTVFWKVQAIDGFELTTWCVPEEGWGFHVYVEQPPDSFVLLSPVDGATLLDTLSVLLEWAESTDPDPGDSVAYWVYLALDSAFSGDIDSQSVSGTELVWEGLDDDQTYWWRVKAFDRQGNGTFSNQTWSFYYMSSSILGEDVLIPTEFALYQNYPNPFNPTTTIRYDVKQIGLISVKVFDILGREVTTLVCGIIPAGSYTVSWDAASLPSGIYLCLMEAAGFMQTRKLVLLK